MSQLLAELFVLVALLFASAFFSGSETALFSLGDVELGEMRRSARRRARQAAGLADRPQGTLVTILFANMIVNVVISVVSTTLCLRLFGAAGLVVAIPAVTLLLLLFGEIVPKTLGLRRGRPLAELAAPVLAGLGWALGPLQRGLEKMAEGVAGTPSNRPLQNDELPTLVSAAQEAGSITRFEGRVLRRVIQFADSPIERCMTPRVDMITVHREADRKTMIEAFERSGRSRVPVTGDSQEEILGILLLKDILTHEGDPQTLRAGDLVREALFEPENLPAGELFRRFQSRRVHMAIAVGEHGGVEGLVTLEDLLEEIIGDIRDESDEPVSVLEAMGDGSWRGDASLPLDEAAEQLGIDPDDLEKDPEDAVTLSGLLQIELGRVPRVGDHVVWHGWELHVLTASPNRPRRVKISRPDPEVPR